MALTVRAGATRGFLGRRVAAPRAVANGARVVMKAGNWLPGSTAPEWLPDDLPGNFGFDPLGLAKEKASLERFVEAELVHCRWAMLAVVGVLLPELLGYGDWYQATLWPETKGAHATWFGIENPIPDVTTLLIISYTMFFLAESQRYDLKDFTKKTYPGGAFDPLGFSKDAAKLPELKLKEIKNGRLAMVAVVGFFGQHWATGKGPLAALGEHLASPWTANFATNGVSVPVF